MQSWSSTRVWILSNRDLCIEALRIYLGIGLFLLGINFINSVDLRFMESIKEPFSSAIAVHTAALIHIGCGFMLCIGLLTRIAALIQVPVVFGAVLFVHLPKGLFSFERTLEFTLLVLFLLITFSIYGSGRLSVDFLLAKRQQELDSQK